MKRSELFFAFLTVPLDYLMIVLAALTAYYIRFSKFTVDIRPAIFNIELKNYLQAVAVIALFWIVIFALAGLYNIRGPKKFVNEFYRIFLACSTGFVLVVIIIFLRRELFDSRFIILAGWFFSIIYVSIERIFIRSLQRYLYRHQIGVNKIILIGDSKSADILMHEFSKNKNAGYAVVKRIKQFKLDELAELAEFVKANDVDEIVQCDPNLTKAETLRLYDFADENHLNFKYAADLLGTKVLKTQIEDISGIPIIEIKKTPLDGWGRIIKRLFDMAVSFLLLLILSPLLLITALAVKADSKGPVFFSRKDDDSFLYRVGQGGKPFKYFKFRSMIDKHDSMRYTELADKNIRSDGPMVKIKDDPRITKVGKFIRRWSIDELPELFLVLQGKMSLVGPRPHLPEEVAKYENHHKKVLTIKPGITGLAQISGRSDLAFEEEVKLDTYYIENWSIFLDISILLRTPLAVFKSREAE